MRGGVLALVLVLAWALAGAASASADVSFTQSWGWGVIDGAAKFEICTSACRAATAGCGGGQLYDSEGVAVDAAGNKFAADTFNNRVQEFSPSGTFVQAWGWGVADGAAKLEVCTSSCRTGIAGAGQF